MFRLRLGPSTYSPPAPTTGQHVAGRALANFGRRAAAFSLDFLIAAALFVVLVGPAAYLAARAGIIPRDSHVELNFFHNWYSLLWLVTYFALTTYFGRGRSPGKRLLKIRVQAIGHEQLSLWQCTERALGYGASALELGFGFLQYFLHPQRQTVHDRIAETIVTDDVVGVRPKRRAIPAKEAV